MMESVEQLKTIREDAISRLRGSDDYKLIGKLGDLITELGGSLTPFPANNATSPVSGYQATNLDVKLEPSSLASTTLSTVDVSTAALTLNNTINELLDDRSDKASEDTADEIVDELVAELESEGLQLSEETVEETLSGPELDRAGDEKEPAPTVSIFKSAQNRFANGSSGRF